MTAPREPQPVQVDLDNPPSIASVRALPDLDERAAVTGAYAAAMWARYKLITDKRLRAALALEQQHGWQPRDIYHTLDIQRRTFTTWQQRVARDGRTIPRLSAKKALETAAEVGAELAVLTPRMEEFQKLRTELFRDLLEAGRSNTEISRLLQVKADEVRQTRAKLKDVIRIPERLSNADRLHNTVVQRISDGTYPVGSKMPGEWQLTKEFGFHRSAATEAYRRLREAGVLRSEKRFGWYVERKPDEQGPSVRATA